MNPRPGHNPPPVPPVYPYGPPQPTRLYQPPAGLTGLPPSMAPPHHTRHGWPPPAPARPAPPATAETRPRNAQAIVAVSLAAVGVLLFTVPLIRFVLGIAAFTLGLIADWKARKRGALYGRLGLLGALLGSFELVSLFGS